MRVWFHDYFPRGARASENETSNFGLGSENGGEKKERKGSHTSGTRKRLAFCVAIQKGKPIGCCFSCCCCCCWDTAPCAGLFAAPKNQQPPPPQPHPKLAKPQLRCPVAMGKKNILLWLVDVKGEPFPKKMRRKKATMGNWVKQGNPQSAALLLSTPTPNPQPGRGGRRPRIPEAPAVSVPEQNLPIAEPGEDEAPLGHHQAAARRHPGRPAPGTKEWRSRKRGEGTASSFSRSIWVRLLVLVPFVAWF